MLRRFFVSFHADRRGISLRKGLLIRRHYDIPAKAVICAEIKHTPLLRLLRGRKVTVRTLSGEVSFYLRGDETLGFLPDSLGYPAIKPRFSSVLLGAFTRTKALGGTLLFSAAVIRVGNILGSGYYDILTELIQGAAGGLAELLSSLSIAVPKIAVVLAVFVTAAWLFAFLRNLLRLSRFVISPSREHISVSHGVITLYEAVFVRNNLTSVLQRDTAATLLMGASPVFCGRTMLFPPLCREKRRKAIRLLFSAPCENFGVKPPARALLGHISVPLGWGGACAALLVLSLMFGSDPVLLTLLWGALLLSAWNCFMYGIYMRRSGMGQSRDYLLVSARKGSELHTVYAPEKSLAYIRVDSSPFQRRGKLCDYRVRLCGRIRLRLRNISEPW